MTETKQEWTSGKVLFVCKANVCRSPMAVALFDALADDRGLSWRAHSAGVAALKGRPMTPNAIAALEEIGVYTDSHQARQVNEVMLEESELVLAMSPAYIAELDRVSSNLNGKIYTLPEYATGVPDKEGVPDPYGSSMVAFRATARQLFEYIDLLSLLILERKE